MTETDKMEYSDYNEYWRDSLAKIEEIESSIDELIMNLESKYTLFEEIYNDIDDKLISLSSIYSDYNIIEGKEELLKLKAVFNSYKKNYTRDGIDFKLLTSLLRKISNLRDESFLQFPLLKHSETIEKIESKKKNYNDREYKWITFSRNNSWFISQFESIEIVPIIESEILSKEEPDILIVKIGIKEYRVKDIFSKFNSIESTPQYFLIINNEYKVFAAEKIGRKLFSHKDILTSEIQPFPDSVNNSYTSGRIRIFGNQHIYLN